MLKIIDLFLLTFFLSSCALFHGGERPLPQKQGEVAELHQAEDSLLAGRFESSYKAFKEFQNKYPQSIYFQSARIGEARSLEGLSRWSEAVPIYQDIYLQTKQYQPEIAALAMYYLSYSYEALGDDVKTVTTLLDAKKLSQHLPSEIGQAEIPARLGVLYGKFGRDKEAASYVSEAERGLKKVIEEKAGTMESAWLAKAYFQMGSISTNQLSTGNFSQAIKGQKFSQVYLLKALRQNDPLWSQKALDLLKENYRNMHYLVAAPPDPETLLAGEALRLRRESQILFGGELISLIEHAELYKPLSDSEANKYQKDFYSFIANLRVRTERTLYQVQETMTLTEESEKLNSIKRIFPKVEKTPVLPPKVVPFEDPNL